MKYHNIKSTQLLLFFMLITQATFASSISVPDQYASIGMAMQKVKKGDTILVGNGVYNEHLYVAPGVTLISRNLFKVSIDGGGRETVVTLGNGASISGFEIRNGTIGVFSTSADVSILRCRIINNFQTGIMCVGNLPQIEDNIIIYNAGSGIQGWDVRSTSASINHNTIAFNSNHGISVGGNSTIIIENNIISNNTLLGLKVSDESVRITLINNNFFMNSKFSGTLPSENFTLPPMYIDAGKFNFMLDKNSQLIGKGTDNQDLGSRIVY
ncbi:MAG: right-handed parallel beta-helix repeat-containing protein [Chitinispirillaceae bacterium]|nr:right-handed parallel beta-helix repeat-containing protein [Chitinispirillaceae bacterium]